MRRFFPTLAMLWLVLQLNSGDALAWRVFNHNIPTTANTMGSSSYSNNFYTQNFDPSWDSVRTFKLMDPLQTPIRVYVQTDSALFTPLYMTYVRESLNAWSNALDGRLTYTFTPNPRQAQIRVTWVSGFGDPYKAGDTNYTVGDADIRIKTRDLPQNEIKGNLMHEFGHALGISNHSDQQGDIMVGMRRWSKTADAHLSQRDILAIRRLYSPYWHRGEDLYQAIASSANRQPVASR